MLNDLSVWQDVVRDRVPPQLTPSGNKATVAFGTNAFNHGLIAQDEGEDISYDIIPTGNYNTFQPNQDITVTFSVTDKGGNTATLERPVEVLGTWRYLAPLQYRFANLNALPPEFTPQNGEWGLLDNQLAPMGAQPASPRWVITHEADANADVQVEFFAGAQGNLLGLLFRFVDLENFGWVYVKDGLVAIRERVAGVDSDIGGGLIPNFDPTLTYWVGATVKDDEITVYVNGQKTSSAKSARNLYATTFGFLLIGNQSRILNAEFGQSDMLTHGELTDMPPIDDPTDDPSSHIISWQPTAPLVNIDFSQGTREDPYWFEEKDTYDVDYWDIVVNAEWLEGETILGALLEPEEGSELIVEVHGIQGNRIRMLLSGGKIGTHGITCSFVTSRYRKRQRTVYLVVREK